MHRSETLLPEHLYEAGDALALYLFEGLQVLRRFAHLRLPDRGLPGARSVAATGASRHDSCPCGRGLSGPGFCASEGCEGSALCAIMGTSTEGIGNAGDEEVWRCERCFAAASNA